MDDAWQWPAPPATATAGPVSVVADDDDDALLRDALAFIGDLDFEVDDTPGTADEDDELTGLLYGDDADVLAPSFVDLPDPALPLYDAVAPVATRSNTDGLTMETVSELAEQSHKPKTINRARTRRREELAYLRGLVGDLEERLTKVRASQEESAVPVTTAAMPSDESTELVDAWAQLAARQQQQRQRSERENAQLKRLLQEQIQVGKSLERLLRRKRPTLEALESESAAEKRRRRANSHAWNNELVFDELLAECVTLFASTARIMARFDKIPPARPLRHVQLVHDPELGMTVQTSEHRVLPFGYEDTAAVVWKSFGAASTVLHHDGYEVDTTEDTMKLQFRVSSEVGRVHGGFDVKLATRRYVDADRTVMVVSGIFDPTDISHTSMRGVRMRYSGWHVIEPMPSGGRAARDASTMFVFYRAVPEVDDDLLDSTRKVGTLTNFVLSTISVEIESRSQNVENELIKLSLQSGSSGE